jgi:hypothetical protein
MAKKSRWNPIVETYRGVPIHKYPLLRINVSVIEMKKIIDLRKDRGLSGRDVLEEGLLICPCKDINITKSVYAKGN